MIRTAGFDVGHSWEAEMGGGGGLLTCSNQSFDKGWRLPFSNDYDGRDDAFLWSEKEENCYSDCQGRAEIWVSTHVLGLIKARRMKEHLQIIQIVGPTVNPAGGAFKNAIPWAVRRNVASSPIRARPCCKVEHARGAEAWNHCWCDDMLSFTFAPLPKGEINEVWRNQTHQKHWRIGRLRLKSFYQTIRPINPNPRPEVFLK